MANEGGVRLDVEQVRAHLHNLYDLATRDVQQTREWEHAERWSVVIQTVAAAPARTYFAVLATALVARSLDGRVDATALMLDAGRGGYSAATVARELVDFASRYNINLRSVGPVPFNNSPFTGKRRVDPDWENVAPANRIHLSFLHAALQQVNALTPTDAGKAAALLFAERINMGRPNEPALLVSSHEGPQLFEALARVAGEFIAKDPESGRRGQAFVAACLSLRYAQVESARVNDPSRRHPGDVRGYIDSRIAVHCEVKQRVVASSEVERFAAQVAGDDTPVALYAALANNRDTVPLDRVEATAASKNHVVLMVYTDPWRLARDAALWSGLPAGELPTRFDAAFIAWLSKMGCRDETLTEWSDLRARTLKSIGVAPRT